MKDMREATYTLGIKICREKFKRLFELSQSMFINKMLKQLSME